MDERTWVMKASIGLKLRVMVGVSGGDLKERECDKAQRSV